MNDKLNGSLNGHADSPLTPSAAGTAAEGKDSATGRFLPGNKSGRGDPHYRRLAAKHTAFVAAVGPDQIKALAAYLFKRTRLPSLPVASEAPSRTEKVLVSPIP
jgi:hypothetical protein